MSFLKTSFTLRGNLTRDAVIRQAGKLYAVNMGVAVTERVYDAASKSWKDSDPAYYNIVKFVTNKDYCEKTALKGQPILATGEIRQRVWESGEGENLKKNVSYDFVVDQLEFLVKPAAKATPAPAAAAPIPADPDIPF